MRDRIVLYGASGFSGRLVARLAHRRWKAADSPELVLAGRSADKLAALAQELRGPVRSFAVDDEGAADRVLGEPGVRALINAAGPFDRTALPLARAAIRARVHYLDLNGEADVYQRLDDLGYPAAQAGVALVSGAGHSAVTSDLMLEQALAHLAGQGLRDIGDIRIAYSHLKFTSQGSAQTAWRSVREQVAVMRERRGGVGRGSPLPVLRITHVPMGQVEHSFDFGDRPEPRTADDRARSGSRRIASACNLLDLFAARCTAQRWLDERKVDHVRRIQAFIEMPEGARIFVQMGALSAPLMALPGVRRLVQLQVGLLPEGPTAREREQDRHTVLLQLEGADGRSLIDWRLETPDPYDFTAACVLAVLEGLLRQRDTTPALQGWRTPSEVVTAERADLGPLQAGAPRSLRGELWAGCVFHPRVTAQQGAAQPDAAVPARPAMAGTAR